MSNKLLSRITELEDALEQEKWERHVELATTKDISQLVMQRLQTEINGLTAALTKARKEIEDDMRYMASTCGYEDQRRGYSDDPDSGNL